VHCVVANAHIQAANSRVHKYPAPLEIQMVRYPLESGILHSQHFVKKIVFVYFTSPVHSNKLPSTLQTPWLLPAYVLQPREVLPSLSRSIRS